MSSGLIKIVALLVIVNVVSASVPIVVIRDWKIHTSTPLQVVAPPVLEKAGSLISNEVMTITVRGETVSYRNITFTQGFAKMKPLDLSLIDFDNYDDYSKAVPTSMVSFQAALVIFTPTQFLTTEIFDSLSIISAVGISKASQLLSTTTVDTHRQKYTRSNFLFHMLNVFFNLKKDHSPAIQVTMSKVLENEVEGSNLLKLFGELRQMQGNNKKGLVNYFYNTTKGPAVRESYYISGICYFYKDMHQDQYVNLALMSDVPGSNAKKSEDPVFVEHAQVMRPERVVIGDANFISVMLHKKRAVKKYLTFELRDVDTNEKLAGCTINKCH